MRCGTHMISPSPSYLPPLSPCQRTLLRVQPSVLTASVPDTPSNSVWPPVEKWKDFPCSMPLHGSVLPETHFALTHAVRRKTPVRTLARLYGLTMTGPSGSVGSAIGRIVGSTPHWPRRTRGSGLTGLPKTSSRRSWTPPLPSLHPSLCL
jgi:hypothetical protein